MSKDVSHLENLTHASLDNDPIGNQVLQLFLVFGYAFNSLLGSFWQ